MLESGRRSGGVFGRAEVTMARGRFVAGCAASSAVLMAHVRGWVLGDGIGFGRYPEVVRVSES